MDNIYYVRIKDDVSDNKWYSNKKGELFEVYDFMNNIYTYDDHSIIDLKDCELVDNIFLYNEMMRNRKDIEAIKQILIRL